jgi:hypothetical protein
MLVNGGFSSQLSFHGKLVQAQLVSKLGNDIGIAEDSV